MVVFPNLIFQNWDTTSFEIFSNVRQMLFKNSNASLEEKKFKSVSHNSPHLIQTFKVFCHYWFISFSKIIFFRGEKHFTSGWNFSDFISEFPLKITLTMYIWKERSLSEISGMFFSFVWKLISVKLFEFLLSSGI